jgi:hypothetical protein
LKKTVLEDTGKRKFPLADTFTTPVSLYREFESGMSMEWCELKLKASGINNTSKEIRSDGSDELRFEDGKRDVTLVFNKLEPESVPVLTACVVQLPPGIRHSEMLEKYKREIPDATIIHEENTLNDVSDTSRQSNYEMQVQCATIQTVDKIGSTNRTINIESLTDPLVDKGYAVYRNPPRKILLFEYRKEGRKFIVPSELAPDHKQLAEETVEPLNLLIQQIDREGKSPQVTIHDNAMAKALQVLQKKQQQNNEEKARREKEETKEF